MKKLLFLLAILTILISLGTAMAASNYTVQSHTIAIQIATEGNDKVTEKFYITFDSEADKVAFRETSLSLGTSLLAWKQYNPVFVPNIGQNTLNKGIAYIEDEESYLQISYDLAEPLMSTAREASMVTEYTMKVTYFNAFYQGGQWIIPQGTTISVELPPGAEIRQQTDPPATITTNISRKVVTWEGHKTTNNFLLDYILWKKISPVVDLNAVTNFLFKTQAGLVLLALVILIFAGIVWQRKKITNAIEDFVEANSVIKEE